MDLDIAAPTESQSRLPRSSLVKRVGLANVWCSLSLKLEGMYFLVLLVASRYDQGYQYPAHERQPKGPKLIAFKGELRGAGYEEIHSQGTLDNVAAVKI